MIGKVIPYPFRSFRPIDLDKLQSCTEKWLLKFNTSKCNVLEMGTATNTTEIDDATTTAATSTTTTATSTSTNATSATTTATYNTITVTTTVNSIKTTITITTTTTDTTSATTTTATSDIGKYAQSSHPIQSSKRVVSGLTSSRVVSRVVSPVHPEFTTSWTFHTTSSSI
nr:A-agglutinin anchorage subunit-like [Procambarus clarkii]